MSIYIVDVETNGPIPGDYSMVSIGAVKLTHELNTTFFGKLAPVSAKYIPEAIAITNVTFEETLKYPKPEETMKKFQDWINETNIGSKALFYSDNNGFDFMFTAWYFHHFLGTCPFGHSSQNINSLYKGLTKNTFQKFKHLRKIKHTHNPVDDALGNATALLEMQKMGLKLNLK